MIRFILNDKEISTDLPSGELLLDLIRYHKHLTGTKIGCREGDCGACTVLIGELINNELRYRSVTSCLTALGNVQGKHVVTVEGLNMNELNPVQQAMYNEGATQCGFCTPGFVVSLAGFCLSEKEKNYENAIAAIDGNICRCTGYKSIQRAAKGIAELMGKNTGDVIEYVTSNAILPEYFLSIKRRLIEISSKTNGVEKNLSAQKYLGGGTDLYVQQHEKMVNADIEFLFNKDQLNGIRKEGNRCIIGASATVTDLLESEIIQEAFPDFRKITKLVSSTPIRNIATIAGNFVNASPIGDFTIIFLALNAHLTLSLSTNGEGKEGNTKREISLRNFYKGYKQLDKKENEIIEQISFELPGKKDLFNFEKVSKRTYLDIASVNSAMSIKTNGKLISEASLSAGGVGPIPMYLSKASAYLKNKKVTEELIEEAIEIAQTEISPISDTRGSEEYKRLLLSQLIKAHFITAFPKLKLESLA